MRCSLWEPYWGTSSLSSMSFLDPKCLLLKHSSTCKKNKNYQQKHTQMLACYPQSNLSPPGKLHWHHYYSPCPLRPWGKGRIFLVAPHFEDVFGCNRLPPPPFPASWKDISQHFLVDHEDLNESTLRCKETSNWEIKHDAKCSKTSGISAYLKMFSQNVRCSEGFLEKSYFCCRESRNSVWSYEW